MKLKRIIIKYLNWKVASSNKLELEKAIRELKKELIKVDTVELIKNELMEKISCIKGDKGNNFIVEYI